MIPYFEYHVVSLGPVPLQVWGLLVAAGIAVGAWLGAREVRRRGLDAAAFLDLAGWSLIGAFIGARVLWAVAYAPAQIAADPMAFFRVWEGGLSSYGGFIGAALVALWYARRRALPLLQYADAAAFALPCGYGIGRVGCFLIHDHPGTLSQSFLAVRYPDGPRLDHGLLLSLLGFALFLLFLVLRKKNPARRDFLPLLMLLYGAARFALDFFRVADARYAGLTPAQYGSFVLTALGGWLLFRVYSKKLV